MIEEAIRAVLYDEKWATITNIAHQYSAKNDKKFKNIIPSRYSIAAKRVAATIKDRPFTATELLVKHVKFAAKYGNVKSLDMEVR